jgi:hypothetical protein
MPKKYMWSGLFIFILLFGYLGRGDLQVRGDEKKSPPPLVIDKSAPLLLDESANTSNGKPAADNSACQVCHMNYAAEPLAVQHAQVAVGCVNCHGTSYAHRNDENNTTPPEKIYAREKIDPLCQGCHQQKHDVPARKVIERWMSQKLDKIDPQILVCTDCHGAHRLTLRSVRWDKNTGKLLSTNKK